MEDNNLEKIDIIRQRFSVSYEEAKRALEEHDWDLVDTLIYMEQSKKGFSDTISQRGNDLLETIKEIIEKGNVNRIKIKRKNKILVDIPVNAGAVAGVLSVFYTPILAIGAITAIVAELKIEIERPNGQVEVINEIVKSKSSGFKDKLDEFSKKAKNKTNDFIRVAKEKGSDIGNEAEEKMIEIKSKIDEKDEKID